MIKKFILLLLSIIPVLIICGAMLVMYHKFMPEEYHVLLDNELSNVENGVITLIAGWILGRKKE